MKNLYFSSVEKNNTPFPESDNQHSGSFYNRRLAQSITTSVRQVLRIIGQDPSLFLLTTRLLSFQKKASCRRNSLEKEGIQVPAVVMISLTHRCNLACHGCYMRSLHPVESPEMNADHLMNLVSQSVDLGVSFIVLAGGEPLIRREDILMLASTFPLMVFAVFTNGLLIDDLLAGELGTLKNIVPILSIEGGEEMTDSRRCEGVYEATLQSFSRLHTSGIFFGCSVTVTRKNYTEVTSDRFIQEMIRQGCRLCVYVEYVPIAEGTRYLVLSSEQHRELNQLLTGFLDQYPALFLGFPGDEELFGGCLSAGRGFIHISPSGDLEPCPAAPVSDANITRMSLRDALNSDLLARIRSHHEMLSESDGGCALWTNQEWVLSLLTDARKSRDSR